MMKMKTPGQLDKFIIETLKSSEKNIPSADWSEVEVLLKHERQTLQVKVSKKTILISSAAAMSVILVFGIFKLIQYYSSLPAENEVPVSANTLMADTQKIVADSSPAIANVKIDTPKTSAETEVDTIALSAQERKADSLIADFKEKAKINPAESKKEKKIKISLLAPTISDTVPAPATILPPDTSGKNKSSAKPDSPVSSDSSKANKNAFEKKLRKNKKGKTSSDSSKVKTPAPAKPDSLK
ncbi:MAG: hypothetical protein HY063_01685 [Bacteroidetes bacterium]|nr:hypothetical protein [Bacteroidota bacterium]